MPDQEVVGLAVGVDETRGRWRGVGVGGHHQFERPLRERRIDDGAPRQLVAKCASPQAEITPELETVAVGRRRPVQASEDATSVRPRGPVIDLRHRGAVEIDGGQRRAVDISHNHQRRVALLSGEDVGDRHTGRRRGGHRGDLAEESTFTTARDPSRRTPTTTARSG